MANENKSSKAVPALSSAIAHNLSASGKSMPAVQLYLNTQDDKRNEGESAAKETLVPSMTTSEDQNNRSSSGDIKPFQLKKVHYNSDKPAQLHAEFVQGGNSNAASQGERQSAHEAWHVVQQAQGRVKQTTQMKTKVDISNNTGVESDVDVMSSNVETNSSQVRQLKSDGASQEVAQLVGEGWAETIAELLQIGTQQAQAFAGYLKDNYVVALVTGTILASTIILKLLYNRYNSGKKALPETEIQQGAEENHVLVEEDDNVVAEEDDDVVQAHPDAALHDQQDRNLARIQQLLEDRIAQQVLKEERKTIQDYQNEVRFNLNSTREVKEDKLDQQDSMIHYIPDLKHSLSERYRQENIMNSLGTVFDYRLQVGDGAQHGGFRFLSSSGVTNYIPDQWTNRNHDFGNSLNTQGVITTATVAGLIPTLSNDIPLIYQIRDRVSEKFVDRKTGETSFKVAQGIDLNNATNRLVIAHIIGLAQTTEARLVKLIAMSSEGLSLSNRGNADINHEAITDSARAAIKAALLGGSVPSSGPPAGGEEDVLPQLYLDPIRQGGPAWGGIIQAAQDAPGHGTLISKIKNQLDGPSKVKFGGFFNHLRFYVWQEFRALYELLNGGTLDD